MAENEEIYLTKKQSFSRKRTAFLSAISLHFWPFVIRYGFSIFFFLHPFPLAGRVLASNVSVDKVWAIDVWAGKVLADKVSGRKVTVVLAV